MQDQIPSLYMSKSKLPHRIFNNSMSDTRSNCEGFTPRQTSTLAQTKMTNTYLLYLQQTGFCSI